MLLLEQDKIRKERVAKIPELDASDNSKEYKIKVIWDSAVYAIKLESGYLSKFFYLVAWKDYHEEENIWEPVLAVQYLKKLISSFYKDHFEKLTITFLPVNIALPMARPTVKPTAESIIKRK